MGSVEQTKSGMQLDDKALAGVKVIFDNAAAAAGSALSGMLGRQVTLREQGAVQGVFSALQIPALGECLAFGTEVSGAAAESGLVLVPQDDMRQVLGILMGGDPAVMEGMPFDEMNMSAAIEVVGQALEAAANALSGTVGQPVRMNVVHGTAVDTPADFATLLPADQPFLMLSVVQSIRDVLEGPLCCLIPAGLCTALANGADSAEPAAAAEEPASPSSAPEEQAVAPAPPPVPEPQPGLEMHRPQFPQFNEQSGAAQALTSINASLLMNVPLDVSIVIGKTKRRIRDILEFGPGTVIELDKQTGAPAEIVVNGQLLAYGDVIVIGDNYGVRITEIVGTKDLLDSLNVTR